LEISQLSFEAEFYTFVISADPIKLICEPVTILSIPVCVIHNLVFVSGRPIITRKATETVIPLPPKITVAWFKAQRIGRLIRGSFSVVLFLTQNDHTVDMICLRSQPSFEPVSLAHGGITNLGVSTSALTTS